MAGAAGAVNGWPSDTRGESLAEWARRTLETLAGRGSWGAAGAEAARAELGKLEPNALAVRDVLESTGRGETVWSEGAEFLREESWEALEALAEFGPECSWCGSRGCSHADDSTE